MHVRVSENVPQRGFTGCGNMAYMGTGWLSVWKTYRRLSYGSYAANVCSIILTNLKAMLICLCEPLMLGATGLPSHSLS